MTTPHQLLPADAATWIRDVVLPPAYRAGTTDPSICPCQYGPSGHCAAGRHERCPRTWGWHRHGEPDPDTHITNAAGRVGGAPSVSSVAVWRTGRPCRWLCPCTCHVTVQPLFAAPERGTPRLSAAGGNNIAAIASTDRALAVPTPQPSLLELL